MYVHTYTHTYTRTYRHTYTFTYLPTELRGYPPAYLLTCTHTRIRHHLPKCVAAAQAAGAANRVEAAWGNRSGTGSRGCLHFADI